MSYNLPPPPLNDTSVSFVLREWLNKLYADILGGPNNSIPWDNVDKVGASLSDLPDRKHSDLQNLAVDDHTQYVLTSDLEPTRVDLATKWDDLTAGDNSTLHYHDSDRNRTNHTGTQTASTISDQMNFSAILAFAAAHG